MFMLLASPAAAATTVTSLGRPTNDVPHHPVPLLDGFRKAGPFFRQGRKPEVLFIGAMVEGNADGTPAIERWALSKALLQFGRFTGLIAVAEPFCPSLPPNPECHPGNGYATLDLDHARYSSAYVALANRDLVDNRTHVHNNLTTTERQLFQRYVLSYAVSPTNTFEDLVWRAALEPGENHGLPLISIGGYLRVDAGVAIPGDLTPTRSALPLSPSAVQQSLVRGKPTGGAPYSLVRDVNVEANVLTALICHADGSRPKSACKRRSVQTIVHAIR